MTRTIWVAAAVALLCGCETTAKQVIDEGPRSTHTLRNSPAIAAGCFARNIENHEPLYGASVRPLDEVAFEVAVRIVVASRTVSVAHIRPTGTGSTATIWMTPYSPYRNDAFIPAMIAGC